MNSHPHYNNAPITEALIDLRVEKSVEIDLSTLEKVHNAIASDYPSCIGIGIAQGAFQFDARSATASASNTPIGYRLSTADQKQVLQVRLDGFTFSRLEPYENWDNLRNEARRLWAIYAEVAQPEKIQRVAVRYINRLNLHIGKNRSLDLQDYLRTVPEVSPDMQSDFSDYLMQLQIPQADLDALLIITQAILPPELEETVAVLLDLDLFQVADFAIDDEPWNLLEKLRLRKNEIFEACITDKTRDLIR